MGANNLPKQDAAQVVNLQNSRKPHYEIETEKRVNEINKEFTHIANGGKNYVVRINDNGSGLKADYFPLREFKDFHLNSPDQQVGVTGKGEPKLKPIADVWLRHPDKSFCPNGVVFDPTTTERFVDGKLNTYYGLSCVPMAHELDLIKPYLLHIRNVICSGNDEYYEYMIKWIAHMFQFPEDKAGVAVLLNSGQGTGKGVFVDPIGKLIGQHYLHAKDQNQVLGKFNASLENKVLIFADEFFGGSKAATDALKTLITESTQTIERKGVDSIQVDSFCRLILASNHDNVVRIERDERRYFYLEVSDCKQDNKEYFSQFKGKSGLFNDPLFLPMLLDYFLSIDLSDFNVRNRPKTDALNAQKLDNLEIVDSFILHLIIDSVNDGKPWEIRTETRMLQESLKLFSDSRNQNVFGDPSRKLGRELGKMGIEKFRARMGDSLKYVYELGDLESFKDKFNKKLGFEVDYESLA